MNNAIKVGTKVKANGFEGTVTSLLFVDSGISFWEVKLPGGYVFLSSGSLEII